MCFILLVLQLWIVNKVSPSLKNFAAIVAPTGAEWLGWWSPVDAPSEPPVFSICSGARGATTLPTSHIAALYVAVGACYNEP
jgi:hypothetical protein